MTPSVDISCEGRVTSAARATIMNTEENGSARASAMPALDIPIGDGADDVRLVGGAKLQVDRGPPLGSRIL
jgi:hypothetical protein